MKKNDEIQTQTNEKAPKKTSKWLIILIVIGCLYYLVPIGLFTFTMIADLTFKTNYKILDDGTVEIDKNKLTIQKDVKGYYNEEKNVYYIEGKLTNNTKKDYNGINIGYVLYNEDGEVLGSAGTYFQKLGPGKTWSFKIIYEDVDAAKVHSFEYNPEYY